MIDETNQELIENYRNAQVRLSSFVMEQARITAHRLGFGWAAHADAPSTYDSLVDAYRRSARTGSSLPVSSLFCTNVIYADAATNHAMRFWHDAHHVQHGLNFEPIDELELGLWHVQMLMEAGFSKASLEYQMLSIDTVGQNYLLAIAGRFPHDQAKFVKRCLSLGVDEGVLAEVRAAA